MTPAAGSPQLGFGAIAWLRLYRALAWLTQPKFTIGAMVYVQRPSGEVLLVRQRLRTPSLWGLPGGFRKSHENASQAAMREVREETGLEVTVRESDLVAEYEQPWAQHLDLLFAVRHDDRECPARPASFEIAEVGWFAPDALPPLTREAALALPHLEREQRERQQLP